MPEFDFPIESRREGGDFSMHLTEIWVDGVPVGVTEEFGEESLFGDGPQVQKGWFSRQRRRKLRFPSRITF